MMTLTERKVSLLSGFALKRLAVLSMIIDHIGSIVLSGLLTPYMNDGVIGITSETPKLVRDVFWLKGVCQVLGNLGFPLFCFLVAEGFLHTGDRRRYCVTLGIFALLSEVPFNLAHFHSLWDPTLQNVLFTLCVSSFTLLAISHVETHWADRPLPAGG